MSSFDLNMMDGDEIGLLPLLEGRDTPGVGGGELNLLSMEDMYAEAPELSRGHSLDSGSPLNKKSKTHVHTSEVNTTTKGRGVAGATAQKVAMTPEELAEVVAAKATEDLRTNGLAFMEQEGNTFRTLEEFRRAFNGANGTTVDSDEENGAGGESDHDGEGSATKKRKRATRPNNPDADLIERATEEQVRILGIDCRGTEGKKQRRRIRNRMSAQLHRERKRLYIDALESFVKLKEERIRALEMDVMKLAKENDNLKHHPQSALLTCLSHKHHHIDSSSGPGDTSITNGNENMTYSSSSTSESVASWGQPSASSLSSGATDMDGHSEGSSSPPHVLSDSNEEDPSSSSSLLFGGAGETMSDDERSILESLLDPPQATTTTTTTTTSTRTRTSTRSGAGTGIRVSSSLAPLFPLLSVICLLALIMNTGRDMPYSNIISPSTGTGTGTDTGSRLTALSLVPAPPHAVPQLDSSSSPATTTAKELALQVVHRRLSSATTTTVPTAAAAADYDSDSDRDSGDILALPSPHDDVSSSMSSSSSSAATPRPNTFSSSSDQPAATTTTNLHISAPSDLRYLLSGDYMSARDVYDRDFDKGLILWK